MLILALTFTAMLQWLGIILGIYLLGWWICGIISVRFDREEPSEEIAKYSLIWPILLLIIPFILIADHGSSIFDFLFFKRRPPYMGD